MKTATDKKGNLFALTEGICKNTVGSFVCECNSGFKNKISDDVTSPCIPLE